MIMIDLLVLFIDEKEITRMPQNIVQKLLKKKNSNVNILRKSYNIDLRLASSIKRKQLSNFIPTFGYIIISNLNRNDWTRSKKLPRYHYHHTVHR